jgi:hypothetical protein
MEIKKEQVKLIIEIIEEFKNILNNEYSDILSVDEESILKSLKEQLTLTDVVRQAREEFAYEVSKYTVENNLALRTASDSLLIAFDQATEKDINYTHCCTELKDKESIDFEDWKLVEKVKCAYGKYFIGNKEFSYKQLIKEYTSYERKIL